MATNYSLVKSKLSQITKQTFKDAIFLCYRDGITSTAPLGFSGDTVALFGKAEDGRVSLVSIRNYSGDVELLITDTEGTFIFAGRYDVDLGVEFLANEYYRIFKLIKHKIQTEMPRISKFNDVPVNENCQYSEGFEILRTYQISKLMQSAT